MTRKSKRTLAKAEKRERRIAAAGKKSLLVTVEEVAEVLESNTDLEETNTTMSASSAITAKRTSTSASYNKFTSPGSKTLSDTETKTQQTSKMSGSSSHKKTTSPSSKSSPEAESKTPKANKMSSTSSKKKKRKEEGV